ncbi:ECF transporter S component [Amylolactobacillus amylophilus]|uniref:ECF transporter S component n=1 Tax=Amylolactobacillus amylophilus TaxID=1603 RepID=UPI0006CF9999|nr:ECF transporter S component [Amylolactobacillus amylophilus]
MRNQNTFNLTLIAIFTAIIFLQAFVPNLGYIVIVPTLPAITTIVLTVSIGGSLLGPCQGAILGLIWGLISLYMAYTRATDPITLLLFQNPVIAVVPRALVGVLSGLVAQALKKRQIPKIRFKP